MTHNLSRSNIISRFGNALARLRVDQRGSVAIIMGILFPVLIGSLALGFEISNWYMRGRSMQNAADEAAITAASSGNSSYALEAKAVTAHYGYVDGSNNVTVTATKPATCPPGTAAGDPCYSVTISSVVPLYLSQIIGFTGNGSGNKLITSTAIAESKQVKLPICLLGLDQSGTAVGTNGAPNSDFTGCTVASNSDSTCNGSNLLAYWGLAAGTNNGCGITQQSNIPIIPDPWAAYASNIPPDPCSSYPQENVKKGTGGNQLAGGPPGNPTIYNWGPVQTFCGDVVLTGDVEIHTPQNGTTLVIYNGQLDVRGHTFATGNNSGLTLVFSGDNGSYEHILSDNSTGQGGVFDVSSPGASGLFPGIAIYQDPSLTTGVNIDYKGNNPQWLISGGVYLPNATVTISGDVAQATDGAKCFVMVTNDVLINGTSNVYQQTPDGSGCKLQGLDQPTAIIGHRGRLVF